MIKAHAIYPERRRKALVLLSGGVDSTVAHEWAKRTFDEVEVISFIAEQRLNWTAWMIIEAHAHAQKINATALVIGTNAVDKMKHSDSTESFIVSMQQVLNLGAETSIHIYAPLINMDKAQIYALADGYDILDKVANAPDEGPLKAKERKKGFERYRLSPEKVSIPNLF